MRNQSKVAPGWWDYTTLDREILDDAARQLADYAIAIRADEAQLRQRLIDRHVAGGKAPGAAARHVDQSDLRNARLCQERAIPADLCLTLGPDGDFKVAE